MQQTCFPPPDSRTASGPHWREASRKRGAQMVLTEGMELVVVFTVIVINLLILVWLQKWSGLT